MYVNIYFQCCRFIVHRIHEALVFIAGAEKTVVMDKALR